VNNFYAIIIAIHFNRLYNQLYSIQME